MAQAAFDRARSPHLFPGVAMTIRIGAEDYGYVYDLKQTELGGLWVCRRGSEWSMAGEKLMLVREDEYSRSTT